MARITAASFVAQATGAATAEAERQAQRREEYLRQHRIGIECTDAWASLMLGVARIDSCIEGFPGRVSLERPNGYRAGVALVRKEGGWRFQENPHNLSFQNDRPTSYFSEAASLALVALRVPHSPAAMRSLTEVAGWSGDIGAALDEALALLPPHTIRALAGNTPKVLKDMGLRPEQAPVLLDALWRATDLFPGMPEEGRDGVRGVLGQAAWNGDIEGVRYLIEGHAVPAGRRAPEAAAEITDALRLAVAGGGVRKLGIVETLLEAGADPHRRNTLKETLLHTLAAFTELRYPAFDIAVAGMLLREGVDAEVTDCHGRTAHHVLRERLEEADITEPSPVLELLDPNRRAPRPR